MKRTAQLVSTLFVVMVALSFVLPIAAFGESHDDGIKIVKLGYMQEAGYTEGGDGEYKTGSGYEYLQRIASYAGWEYEYTYGSFEELMDKLASGEIDLMPNISYTEERAKKISYSAREQGRESFYLYVCGDDSQIKADDYSTINGKKIGTGAGYYQEELWNKWCKKHDVDCEVVEFPTDDECHAALNDGQIDGVIGSLIPNLNKNTADWQSVFSFGEAPYYFVVSKSKPNILKELNRAQGEILSDDPYYNEKTVTRYLPNGILARRQISETEKKWLDAHQDPLKVGCLDNYLPLCDMDENGNMKGVIADLFAAIQDNYAEDGVTFQLEVYQDYRQMINDLNDGSIDIAAPVYSDYWNAETNKISLTDTFLSTTMLLLKNGSSSNDVTTIGIDRQSPVQSVYAQIYFPDKKLVLYRSASEVAKAVKAGEVDAALSSACCYHVSAILDKNIGDLSRSTMPNSVNLSMAVAKRNPQLLSLLNRGISTVSEATINNSLTVNSNVKAKVTLNDFVAANPLATILICGSVIAVLLIIISRLRKANIKARTDAMTGLLNKVSMREQMSNEIEHGGVLFIIDVDDFKIINDTLGHNAGDEVIESFSQELQSIFRGGDLIGRFGGDEFTVFLPVSSLDESIIQQKVAAMQKAISSCPAIQDANGQVKGSVSVGVCIVEPDSAVTYAEAFTRADAALYQAKQQGKSSYVIAR